MASRRDLLRHLQREPLLPVYAITSTVPLLLTEAVAALRRAAVTHAADFNADSIAAGAGAVQQALDAATQLPVMAARRFVHLAPVAKLPAKEQALLLPYLARPVPTTVLCLAGDKLDLRTKLGTALARGGAHFVLEAPRPHELPQWVAQRAAAADTPIAPDAAALLADLVGGELGTLVRSLEKVALYAGDARPLTAEHVAAAVAQTRAHGIFELTDAVGKRHFAPASVLLHEVLGGGESGLLVLTMLVRQLRQLLRVKELERRPVGHGAMAQALGVRPFLVETLRAQAARFTVAELHTALTAAGAADAQLKSSRLSAALVLDGLLATIARPGAAAAT